MKVLLVGAALPLMLAAGAASAAVTWGTWSNTFTPGPKTGTATETIGTVTASYTGDVHSVIPDFPSFTPASSFTGSGVPNAPPQTGGILQLTGGPQTRTETITFSSPVTDPVMAIWSLGSAKTNAEFVFTQNEPFSIVAGGPSAEHGGGALTLIPDGVSGMEGNGTLVFKGTYSSLTFTNPDHEFWYGFTLGANGAVPEPATWAMMILGMSMLGGVMRSRRAAQAIA
jgi:PEP-CTERM motif